jgi:tetratricopeptide (TPR) repeat protein
MYPYSEEAASTFQRMQQSRDLFKSGKENYAEGNYSKSLQLFRRTVQMQEVIFGKYHKETIRSYLEMGKAACKVPIPVDRGSLVALKAFQRASRMGNSSFDKESYQHMLRDIEHSWYEVNPKTDVSLGVMMEIFSAEELGDKAFKKKSYAAAIEHYYQALSLQDSLVGRDSLDGADIRYKLGCSLLRTSAMPQAQETLQLAYECYVDQVGKDHPATMGVSAKMKSIAV